MNPLDRWEWVESYRGPVKRLDRLDDLALLHADGVEVLLSFLEEVCSRATSSDSGVCSPIGPQVIASVATASKAREPRAPS